MRPQGRVEVMGMLGSENPVDSDSYVSSYG